MLAFCKLMISMGSTVIGIGKCSIVLQVDACMEFTNSLLYSLKQFVTK